MPGYLSMANKPPVISAEIRTRLEASRIARLATQDADRMPHVIPICFAWDGSAFYSAIDKKPKQVAPTQLVRLKNIKETPHVALLVDQYDEDWTRLWYVLVHGQADLVSSKYMAKFLLEGTKVEAQNQEAYRVQRTEVFGQAVTRRVGLFFHVATLSGHLFPVQIPVTD